jgi:hypothetical protein
MKMFKRESKKRPQKTIVVPQSKAYEEKLDYYRSLGQQFSEGAFNSIYDTLLWNYNFQCTVNDELRLNKSYDVVTLQFNKLNPLLSVTIFIKMTPVLYDGNFNYPHYVIDIMEHTININKPIENKILHHYETIDKERLMTKLLTFCDNKLGGIKFPSITYLFNFINVNIKNLNLYWSRNQTLLSVQHVNYVTYLICTYQNILIRYVTLKVTNQYSNVPEKFTVSNSRRDMVAVITITCTSLINIEIYIERVLPFRGERDNFYIYHTIVINRIPFSHISPGQNNIIKAYNGNITNDPESLMSKIEHLCSQFIEK